MGVYELTAEGIREAVGPIELPCDGCPGTADKVLSCRENPAAHRLFCQPCLAALETHTAASPRPTLCNGCGATARTLAELADITDITPRSTR